MYHRQHRCNDSFACLFAKNERHAIGDFRHFVNGEVFHIVRDDRNTNGRQSVHNYLKEKIRQLVMPRSPRGGLPVSAKENAPRKTARSAPYKSAYRYAVVIEFSQFTLFKIRFKCMPNKHFSPLEHTMLTSRTTGLPSILQHYAFCLTPWGKWRNAGVPSYTSREIDITHRHALHKPSLGLMPYLLPFSLSDAPQVYSHTA